METIIAKLEKEIPNGNWCNNGARKNWCPYFKRKEVSVSNKGLIQSN